MKKILIFVAFLSIMVAGAFTVYGQETTIVTSTYQTISTAPTINDEKVYYYNDYQDLISQVYADVYADIYEDLYNDIISELTTDSLEEIYDGVAQRAVDLLQEEDISVYFDDFQNFIYDVVDIADNSVLGVINYQGNNVKAVGSGVVYRHNPTLNLYYIITNEHVIAGGDSYSVSFSDGSEYVANLLGFDTEVDIAILSFSASDKTAIQVSKLGDSENLVKGTFLIAAGNPQGFNFYGSITLGIISGLERKVDYNQYIDYIQHDSAINPGNSGGPIYNLAGEVIGINVSKYADTEIEGMGFAIPINLVKRIITRIEAGTLVSNTIMPRLGAKYYDVGKLYKDGNVSVSNLYLNGELRTDKVTIILPVGIDYGFLVYEIDETLTLAATDIRSGDLIYRIDDFLIDSKEAYFEYMYNNHEAGNTITIYYYELDHNSLEYNSTPKSVQVTLI